MNLGIDLEIPLTITANEEYPSLREESRKR